MAGGAAEPESLLPGGGLEPALWHLFSRLLVRRTFPGKALLDSILHLPLVLPPVVVGYLLLVAMGRRGFIGSWLYDWFGISFAFSWRGAVLAAAVMSFPLMVRAIRWRWKGWTSNWSKRREPSGPAAGGYFDHYVAVDSAGNYCRHGAGLRPLVRGVWRDHHVRFQYSR